LSRSVFLPPPARAHGWRNRLDTGGGSALYIAVIAAAGGCDEASAEAHHTGRLRMECRTTT
jgi:hypothetical protein